MSFYDYYCPANKRTVEVRHAITKKLATWGEVCQAAGIEPGKTPLDSPVERLINAPGVATPMSDSKLKELGFSKLVKRDKGVYENVTAAGKEKRIVKANDPSTFPDFKKKGLD
jgi:hypothetical protein